MTVLYFIFALIALGFLVFIHELGHYFVARWVGMRVETFSIGFGKPLLKWERKGVQWQLAMLPFGGFVKIAGTEFGKKDANNQPIDPYKVEGGFFQRSPLKRIAVAVAGPCANFILAFLIFVALYFAGGRVKPFSEYTKIVGWVDPDSELYADGLRPGDVLTKLNGKAYTNSKDLLYAAMASGENVTVEGLHVNYDSGEKTPFKYTVERYLSPLALNDLYTTGIQSGAKYLIYDKTSPLMEGSPMEGSGIESGDRLVWADGQLIFSLDQLSHLLNSDKAYVTVKRKDQTFFSRQKRVLASDLIIPPTTRNELQDWQYEAGLKGRWQDLYVLPYILSADGTIVGLLSFIDGDCQKEAFATREDRLEVGDRLIAIDGVAVETSYQLLDLLQTKHVNLIVEKDVSSKQLESWKEADRDFVKNLDTKQIEALAATVGTKNAPPQEGRYTLLRPVQPKRLDQFNLSPETRQAFKTHYDKQRQEIENIKSPERKAKMLKTLNNEQHKYILGVTLEDRQVEYNPSPFAIFSDVFSETFMTLKALIFGYLNPKWLAGPIGIVQVIQHGWKVGVGEALFWISAISVNLGVLNLLPIPVLDGGYICLSLWEIITRRQVKPRTIEKLIVPFVILLIGLIIFLTFQDISRFF